MGQQVRHVDWAPRAHFSRSLALTPKHRRRQCCSATQLDDGLTYVRRDGEADRMVAGWRLACEFSCWIEESLA